jgi:hypothetical protein
MGAAISKPGTGIFYACVLRRHSGIPQEIQPTCLPNNNALSFDNGISVGKFKAEIGRQATFNRHVCAAATPVG